MQLPFALAANNVAHQAAPAGIESGGRLVQNHQVRFVQQRLRQADALQHSLGELAHLLATVVAEPDELEQRIPTMRSRERAPRGHAVKPSVHAEQFFSAKPIVEAEVFGEEADAAPDLNVADWRTEYISRSGSRRYQTQQHLHRRAFAGAVRSKKTKDLAAANFQRQAFDRDLLAEDLAQAASLDGEIG